MKKNELINTNKMLLKKYALLTKNDSLKYAIAETKDNIVRDGFRTMKWYESKHNQYTDNLRNELGPAVTVKHTDWVQDGPTETRGTDIEINLVDPSLRQRLEAVLSVDSKKIGQESFASKVSLDRNDARTAKSER